MTQDAWSSLQAQGVEASDKAPAGTTIAYADTTVSGHTVVGFQLGLELPARCFKCGVATAERCELRLRAHRGVAWRLREFAEGNADWYRAISETKFSMHVPMCQPCQRARKQAERVRLFAVSAPAWIILGASLSGLAWKAGVPWVLLALFVASIGVWIWAGVLQKRAHLLVEQVDEDGVIRISGVDYETAQEIVRRATTPRSAA